MDASPIIESDALMSFISAAPSVVLDCRFDLAAPSAGRLAFIDGHIPNAIYADLNQDLSAPLNASSGRHPLPAPEVFAGKIGAWGIGNETQVIVYDGGNGSIAARAWWLLRWVGAKRVVLLNGGFKAWRDAGGAVESGTGAPPTPARFTPKVRAHDWVSTAEVIEALAQPQRMLVDARAAIRYAGESEPIDAVAGHVPGATNYPFSMNLDPAGRLLPPLELRQRWLAFLAGTAPANLIAMCGSGVTACHNLLALEIAGLGGAKLYAGSWSEWIRDPARQVERFASFT